MQKILNDDKKNL